MPGVISTYKFHHRKRLQVVREALNNNEGRRIYDLIGKVFSYVSRDDDIFLAISVILVHLEFLIHERRAEIIDNGTPVSYRTL